MNIRILQSVKNDTLKRNPVPSVFCQLWSLLPSSRKICLLSSTNLFFEKIYMDLKPLCSFLGSNRFTFLACGTSLLVGIHGLALTLSSICRCARTNSLRHWTQPEGRSCALEKSRQRAQEVAEVQTGTAQAQSRKVASNAPNPWIFTEFIQTGPEKTPPEP